MMDDQSEPRVKTDVKKVQLKNLHQKRRAGHLDQTAPQHPLPIVIKSLSGFSARADTWPCYHGIFTGHTIVVASTHDAKPLHSMGSFGNYLSNKDHSSQLPKILRRRQYDRRLSWENILHKRHAKLDESGSEGELEVPDISELRVPCGEEDIFLVPRSLSGLTKQNSNSIEEIVLESEVQAKCGDRGWFPQLAEWGNLTNSNGVQQSQSPPPSTKGPQIIDVDDDITILSDAEEPCQKADDKENQHPNVVADTCANKDDDVEIIVKEVQVLEESSSQMDSRDDDEDICLQVSDNESDCNVEKIIIDESKFQNEESEQDEQAKAVIVINDTDCTGSKETLLKHWCPELRLPAFTSCDDTTTLSLEEGFFLAWALNCLQICASKSILCEVENSNRDSPQPGPSGLQINEALIDLSPIFLWSLFSQVQSTFPFRYAVYHHLRSKGWVVKSGCKFGGDFVIYKDSPSLYHASSVVIVETAENKVSWQTLLTLNRIAGTASKEVVVCSVSWPDYVSTENISWLSKVYISDRVVGRHTLKQGATQREENSEDEYSDKSDV